jgi:hypothetical protein
MITEKRNNKVKSNDLSNYQAGLTGIQLQHRVETVRITDVSEKLTAYSFTIKGSEKALPEDSSVFVDGKILQ